MKNWKPVVGYGGCYEVSDCGRVRSLTRKVNSSLGKTRVANGVELKHGRNEWGHRFVNLCSEGKQKYSRVHRLVLGAFVGPCPDGMECRHLDGDATNNHVSNLAWGTHQENEDDKIIHGVRPRGEKQGSSKLTEWDVRWIRKFLKYGFAKQSYLAEIFGVSDSRITEIKNGKSWGWLT